MLHNTLLNKTLLDNTTLGQCIVATLQCTLYTADFTLYNSHCIMYTVHCERFTVHRTVYIVHCKVYSITVKCTMLRLIYAVTPVLYCAQFIITVGSQNNYNTTLGHLSKSDFDGKSKKKLKCIFPAERRYNNKIYLFSDNCYAIGQTPILRARGSSY